MTSRLVVNSVRHTGASADALTLDSNGGVTIPTKKLICPGTIIQVVETKITARSSVTMTTTMTDVPGFSVTITPTSASNKIKLTAMINNSSRQQHGGGRFVRSVGGVDAVPTGWIGDAAGSRTRSTTGNLYGNVYIDANGTDSNFAVPCCLIDDSHNTTSAITYKFQISNVSGTYPIKFNTADDDDGAATHVAVSSMIVEEIAA
jgi:hypothetical protein|tara:strand:- start:356 stop:967 length:612 start_codon:yes stop_codon:yes gene_type:complete